MAKKEATKKEVKKQGRRMKRSVRKTLGALFLASAVAVAAIPTDNLRAADSGADDANRTAPSVKVEDSKTILEPFKTGPDGDTVYRDDSGKFRFAMSYNSDGDFVATILGYSSEALQGEPVTIPEVVQPYLKFSEYAFEGNGYVAVGRAGNFLYWKDSEIKTLVFDHELTEAELAPYIGRTRIEPQLIRTEFNDKDGITYYTYRVEELKGFKPCYSNTDDWKKFEASELYYDDAQVQDGKVTVKPGQGNSSLTEEHAVKTIDNAFQPFRAPVRYIGSQYLEEYKEGDNKVEGAWMVGGPVTADNKNQGVFAGKGNISELIVGPNLQGIGDYAFYGCGGLNSITLADGLQFIGEGAFELCNNMTTVTMPVKNNLRAISQRAFFNCALLESFTLPLSVEKICDSAFEGCTALKEIDLLSAGNENRLTELGRDVFKNCSSLKNITFPTTVTGDVYLSIFDGCRSLEYISTRSWDINFVAEKLKGEDDKYYYSYTDFRDILLGEGTTVNGAFYFEGIAPENREAGISRLHKMTEEQCFAFSYLFNGCTNANYEKQNKYELTVQENDPEGDSADGRAHYVVNNNNEMIGYWAADNVTNVTIPSKIGPYTVSSISSKTFQTKCYIVKVYIPANVTSISADAFKGCHNLRNVIFESEDIEIGENAFKTQDISDLDHDTKCDTKGTMTDSDGLPAVKLNFIGPISATSGSYQYAMSSRGIYSNSKQKVDYITYLTGWPQNMKIQYNPVTGMSELVDFPSFSEMIDADGPYYAKDKNNNYVLAYMTDNYKTAMMEAKTRYQDSEPREDDTTDWAQAYRSVMQIVIPEGVESVRDGLFKEKENADIGTLPGKKTVKAYSLKRIKAVEEGSVSGGDAAASVSGTFAGCSEISSIQLLGGVETLDTYAFLNCRGLLDVTLPATLNRMGTRPFAGCSRLSVVNFSGGPYFECDNSIIYELEDRARAKVVECLEGRSDPFVESDELAGVWELYPEAFVGTKLRTIDLSETSVVIIPERTFMNNASLTDVTLPRFADDKTIRDIRKDAFTDCPSLIKLVIPNSIAYIDENAFGGTTLQYDETKVPLYFYCEEGSFAEKYASNHSPYIQAKPIESEEWWEVQFGYRDEQKQYVQIGETQTVKDGDKATPPDESEISKIPVPEGYVFAGWNSDDYLAVHKDLQIEAQFGPADKVTFIIYLLDENGVVWDTCEVPYGGSTPKSMGWPIVPGKVFLGWRIQGGDGSIVKQVTNVRSSMLLQAVYKDAEDGEDDGSGTLTPGPDGSDDGSGGNGSGGNGSGGNGSGGNGNDGASGTFYILTVQNGSGSGSYREGDQPVIIANDPASGQVFDYWSITPDSTKIASTALSATIVTMPAGDVTVTAHYKVSSGSGSGGSGSGSGGSGSGNQRPNGSGSGGTTVVIDKNGLSNTGVVSVTVNGSSDNFTIKISESNAATEAALKALLAEYGSLDNLVYFPMDISLYDSTGTKKITDTTGLSVTITLPLPDSMITYAGNNQVAGVVNDKLDRLSARFSTIQGVSCITFTATHFSPYVIYVNTGNLSSGMVSDSTPQTGDGIHPKWFLSIGLACLSFVFFMQTDSRKPKKVKVKVRA